MFKHLEMNERVSSVLATVVITAFALLLCLGISTAPKYADFIVGYISWTADTKFQDQVVAPVFIAVLFCALLFFTSLMGRQKKQFGSDSALVFSNQLLWWSLPAITAIACMVLGTDFEPKVLYCSVFGVSFIALAVTVGAVKKVNVDPRVFGLGALGILLLALVQLEVVLALGRAPAAWTNGVELSRYAKPTYGIAIVGWILGMAYIVWSPKGFARIASWLVMAGQLGLSTFYLALYPARIQEPDGSISKYETTVWLKVLVIAMLVWGVVDVLRRFRRYTSTSDIATLLSPIAFFGLLVGLKMGTTIFPNISAADYHFGESLLGWWSYLQGAIPYIDYIPAHGVIGDDLTQFLSFVFYDGSAGSIIHVGNLSIALLSFAAFLSLYYFSRSIGLAFAAIFFLTANIIWLFLIPFLCLWLSPSLRQRPERWLLVWMVTAPLVVLGIPPQGLLLAAASGVMAAYYAWHLWKAPRPRKLKGILIASVVLLVLAVVTPAGIMLLGAIRYVLENGPINQVAYGVPWALSWEGARKGFVFEALRMSWIAIPLACLLLVHRWFQTPERRLDALLPLLVVFLFALLLIPYSMGRVDPGGMSRPGLAASFGWAILLPIACWGMLSARNKVVMVVLAASMSASLGFTQVSINNLVKSTMAVISTQGLGISDGVAAGLPNIGRSFVQPPHWDRLTRLSRVLADNVPAGETYLDLTSRNAQYFYLGYRPLLPVTAAYNMVSPAQQLRAIETLKQDLPTIALLEGMNIIHDGGGLALRNPYLYRFIVDHYEPFYVDGFILGRKKGSASAPVTSIEIPLMDFTDANWSHGINRAVAALYVSDPGMLAALKVGDHIQVNQSEIRRIREIRVAGQSVWLEGSALQVSDADPISHPRLIEPRPEAIAEYQAALLQRAFASPDLKKIPVAWGRSQVSLSNKMVLINNLDNVKPSLNQLVAQENSYRVDGGDPSMSFDLSALNLSGHDAGLLKFEFRCSGRAAEPRMQVFWWGDGQQGPLEASSVRFNAEDGTLIVPLDASPRWLTLQHVKGIRIDLDNAGACSSFKVDNLGLYQRQH